MADPAYIVDGVLTDGEAWVGIATTTLGSDTATVTFTSTDDGQVGDWSQYMDLVVVGYGRSSRVNTNDAVWLRFNSDTTEANYAGQHLSGSGSSVSAFTDAQPTIGIMHGNSAGANEFAALVVHLFDVNSGKYKTSIGQSAQDSSGDGYVYLVALTWKDQSAITDIEVISKNAANLKAGSRFDLFGVLPRMVA